MRLHLDCPVGVATWTKEPMKFAILLLVIGLTRNAHARLGESEQQLTNRYGAAFFSKAVGNLKTLAFHFSEYVIVANVRDGKSTVESVKPARRGQEISNAAALAIAGQIAGATNWVRLEGSRDEMEIFDSRPKGFTVYLDRATGKDFRVTVTSLAELDRKRKEAEDADKRSADGF